MNIQEQAIKFGAEMTILDAIENGHTDSAALIEYMASDVFQESAKRYAGMFIAQFGSIEQ